MWQWFIQDSVSRCHCHKMLTKCAFPLLTPLSMGGLPGELSEELVMKGEAKEGLENELWHKWSNVTSPASQLILQYFRRFTYVTAHSLTLPLLHLRHSSFSNPSFASPASKALHLIHLASRPCWKLHSMTSPHRILSKYINEIHVITLQFQFIYTNYSKH